MKDRDLSGRDLRSLQSLPANMQAQLADYFAMTYILGVTNFGPERWAVHRDQVSILSLTNLPETFDRGQVHILTEAYTSPFGWALILETFKWLNARISPEVLNVLQGLTKEKIETVEDTYQFALRDLHIKGMLDRRDELLHPVD